MKDIRSSLIKISIVVLLVLLCAANAHSKEAKISDVVVSTSNEAVLSFVVSDAMTKDIEEAIKSGIATAFTFRVKLYRKKSFWIDTKVKDISFRHTVNYNTLKDEYYLTLDEKGNDRITLKNIDKMKELMVTVKEIPLIRASISKKQSTYKVKIKAELDTIDLPFPLNHMLFFVSFWNFETDWHTEIFSH